MSKPKGLVVLSISKNDVLHELLTSKEIKKHFIGRPIKKIDNISEITTTVYFWRRKTDEELLNRNIYDWKHDICAFVFAKGVIVGNLPDRSASGAETC